MAQLLGLATLLLAALAPSAPAAYLKEAPADPVVDEARILTEEQRVILREAIKETADHFDLHVFIVTTNAATVKEAQREAILKVHLWAPSGYAAVAMFSTEPGVEPLLTYSQDITLKLSDDIKAKIERAMLDTWGGSREPSEKVYLAARQLIRNELLWDSWTVRDRSPEVLSSVSFSSAQVKTDGETAEVIEMQREGEKIGGNAEKVEQQEEAGFFDWQKRMMVINAVIVFAIIGGALYAYFSQRRASLEREEQMKRGQRFWRRLNPPAGRRLPDHEKMTELGERSKNGLANSSQL